MQAGMIENVFTEEDIGGILNYLQKIPNQFCQDSYKNIKTNGFTDQDLIYPLIHQLVVSRINQVCAVPLTKLTVGMHMIAQEPFHIHTDFGGKNDSGYGIAYLIPLYSRGKNATGSSFTAVFNEHSIKHTTFLSYMQDSPNKPQGNARSIWNQLPESKDPEKLHWADYLSVKVLAHWVPGALIYWDRRLYHSSDDFQAKGITEKSALVLFASDESIAA